MKLNISTVALVALAAMVSAAAAGASQDKPDAQKPATMDAPGMTLTGCVARGTAPDTFTLAEVKKGAPVAADASTPAPLVTLTGTEVDLSKHVGHSVTLTGSFASPTCSDRHDRNREAGHAGRARRQQEGGGKDLYGQVAEDGFPDLPVADG